MLELLVVEEVVLPVAEVVLPVEEVLLPVAEVVLPAAEVFALLVVEALLFAEAEVFVVLVVVSFFPHPVTRPAVPTASTRAAVKTNFVFFIFFNLLFCFCYFPV